MHWRRTVVLFCVVLAPTAVIAGPPKSAEIVKILKTIDPIVGEEATLGEFLASKSRLKAKPNIDVAFPILHLWVGAKIFIPLKTESRTFSDRLVQTTYYPKWIAAKSPVKERLVYYPTEMRTYNELNSKSQTVAVVQRVTLASLKKTSSPKPGFKVRVDSSATEARDIRSSGAPSTSSRGH